MLKTNLDTLGKFTQTDLELLGKHLLPRQFGRNELLLDQGQTCRSVYFICSGSVYQFRYDDIEEKVVDLHVENEWCLSYASFISQTPSQTIIKANSETTVLELTIYAMHHLIALSPAFLQLGKILEGALFRTHYLDYARSPADKYNHLVQTRPKVLSMFPLKRIASYLNMTPETLSRVRSVF